MDKSQRIDVFEVIRELENRQKRKKRERLDRRLKEEVERRLAKEEDVQAGQARPVTR